MSINKILKNSVYILSFIAVLMVAVLCFYPGEVVSAVAVPSFESSAVFDDLDGMTIDGKVFNPSDYPKDPYGKISAVTFVEYCFSQYENTMGNYGLYIYLHNPSLINIDSTHVLNKISMAIEFNEKDMPSRYKKFSLKFCSKTSDGQFYKFRVVDSANEILSVIRSYAVSHSGKRPYYVSEVELVVVGQSKVTTCSVGTQYVYEGFANGYGDSENFPLKMTSLGLETIQTDLHYAFYRPEGTTEAYGHTQSQLNSVYFCIPTEKIEKYGCLSAVHMEWYEYLTKLIFVVNNQVVFSRLKDYIGQDVKSYNSSLYYGLFSIDKLDGKFYYYNKKPETYSHYDNLSQIDTLYYLFKENFSEYLDLFLSSEKLLTYIASYQGSGEKINGKYYSELFEDYVLDGRTRGYNEVTVKAEDEYSLTNMVTSRKWWQLFTATTKDESFDGIEGIRKVTSADFVGSVSDICKRLYIDESCYDKFYSVYSNSLKEGNTLFLLRYAVTDYSSSRVEVHHYSYISGDEPSSIDPTGMWELNENVKGVLARQTAFLDLDLIDVTFRDEQDVDTVIPVVSSPIDAIGGITAPPEIKDESGLDLKKIVALILGLIILIIILIIFWPILQPFLSVLWHILSLPFYLIAEIFKSIKNKSKRE